MIAAHAFAPLQRHLLARTTAHMHAQDGLATGWVELDMLLPGGGWPSGALTELLHAPGDAALRLLLPALARLTRTTRRVVLIEPPAHIAALPFAQLGLRREFVHVVENEARAGGWNAEQYLRSGCASAVILWPHANDAARLAELQRAAEAGACHAFALRETADPRGSASAAALRISVTPTVTGTALTLLRCRGLRTPKTVRLEALRAAA